MKTKAYLLEGTKGVTAVIVAIVIVMILGFAALAVDIGYGMVARNELQNTADAAALAGARQLGVIYQAMSYADQLSYVVSSGDETLIKNAAMDVAYRNKAGGVNMVINPGDIVIGNWDSSLTPPMTPTMEQPHAVRVTASRNGSANGPISTFFARILGINTMSFTAIATAALTAPSTSEGLYFPVGISKWWFENHACNDMIQFNPSNSPDSCAGWTSWEYNSNDATLRRILNENPGFLAPEAVANESIFNFTGGELSNPTFAATLSLFQRKGYDVDSNGAPILDGNGEPLHDATGRGGLPLCEGVTETDCAVPCDATHTVPLLYPDGTPRNKHEWLTSVPVYDRNDCSNPNQSILIVGFAKININNICNAPYKIIRAEVECSYVDKEDSHGGGGSYGVFASIPGLVE